MLLRLVFAFFFFALPLFVHASSVSVSEVIFDPAGTDTGLEWVEIYNGSDAAINLFGWQLYPDGIGYYTFPSGFSLDAKSTATIHLRVSGEDTATDLYFPAAAGNMGNTSGSVALFSSEPRGKDTIKSFVQWGKAGETWESDAASAGLWTRGDFIDLADFVEGNSIGLKNMGNADGGKDAWKIFTANDQNGGQDAVSPPPPSVLSTSPPASTGTVVVPAVSIFAYAGEDRTTVAGAEVYMNGQAFGSEKKPLENARYLWNFGDGAFEEGKNITHIFRIPGTYTVGLHVASGEYAASDYLTVKVGPNRVRVESVVGGEDGYIVLTNPADFAVEIGGWMLEDAFGAFVIPAHTLFAARSEIGFANDITKLLMASSSEIVTVRFPNGRIAFVYEAPHPVAIATVPVDSESPKVRAPSMNAPPSVQKNSIAREKPTAKSEDAAQVASAVFAREDILQENRAAASSSRGISGFGMFMIASGVSAVAAFGFFIIKILLHAP